MATHDLNRSLYRGVAVLVTMAILHFRIGASLYIGVACGTDHQRVTVNCGENEIIRVHRTVLSFVPSVPGQPDPTCNDIDTEDYCHALTNRSDAEFVGRRSASFAVPSEDLQNHPEKQGNCFEVVRSNVVQLYYECVPTEGSRLNSVCDDVMWENEFDGYVTSPYFPGNFPSGSDELECECELRPESGSRVEINALLINPSTSGTRWSIQVDTASGYSQEISSTFRASREILLQDSTNTVYLRFRSYGTGTQQPARSGPPPGFWLQYKAVSANAPPRNRYYYGDRYQPPGKVTLYCNDPPPLHPLTAGAIAGIVVGSILFVVLIVLIIWCAVVRLRKGKTYRADEPHVYSGRTNQAMENEHGRRRKQAELDHEPPAPPHYHISPRMSSEDYPEKEPYSHRPIRGRSYSNSSYNDKVFLDEVDKKSLPSSGRTGDNDSIAKKSLSTDSQADNYSEVNYSPKAIRFSGSSIGKDTAV